MLKYPFTISFHPCVELDVNILLGNKPLSYSQKRLVKQAQAVVLPQACRPDVYWFCRWYCRHVFPNYDYRFPGEGKVGDALLWKSLKLPHPPTVIYTDVNSFVNLHFQMKKPLPFDWPLVIKANRGGEGSLVYLVKNQQELELVLEVLQGLEKNQGWYGFILQRFIPNQKRDLRVVIIGEQRFFYWRVQKTSNFKTNLACGAVIDPKVSPGIRLKVNAYLDRLIQATGINLAAIDVLYPENNEPLFLEINHYFGRQGLGGSEAFYKLLREEVNKWLKKIKGH